VSSLIYLHGLADGPADAKGRHCRNWAEARGIVFHGPDLNLPTFESLTITAQLNAVEILIGELESPPVLVGSSLGGLVAAAVAHRAVACGRPGLKALILLAPAFGFARRRLESDFWAGYRLRGQVPVWHSVMARWARLGPELLADLPAWTGEDAWRVDAPTIVIHGRRDSSVPVEESERFVRRQSRARLLILDDEHDLSEAASLKALDEALTAAFEGEIPSIDVANDRTANLTAPL